jgi:hypothetical protein
MEQDSTTIKEREGLRSLISKTHAQSSSELRGIKTMNIKRGLHRKLVLLKLKKEAPTLSSVISMLYRYYAEAENKKLVGSR